MGDINIIQAINDPNIYGPEFLNPSWDRWKTVLKAVFGLPLSKTGDEKTAYNYVTSRKIVSYRQFKSIVIIAGRRSGKTKICSAIATYLACFHDFSKYLSRGEKARVLLVAVDRKQANTLFWYIREILALPMFKGMVEKELKDEIRLTNNVIINIQTCDFRSLRGYTVACAILDEVAFFRADGASPDFEIYNAVRPAMATIPNSMLFMISSPYARSGLLYEMYRKYYGVDNDQCLVVQAPTDYLNPTIDKKIIESAYQDDLSIAQAEWGAQFRADIESFLSTEAIENCIIPGRFELPFIDKKKYVAFVDSASGSGSDSFTMAIGHKGKDDLIVLDVIREKKPPFKPGNIIEEYSTILKEYKISKVKGDAYAPGFVENGFKDNGITYERSDKNKSEIYSDLAPIVNQGAVELLDNKKMFSQLRSLERRTRSSGKDLIDHPARMNDDVANAVAGCVLCVKDRKKGGIYFTEHSFYPDDYPGVGMQKFNIYKNDFIPKRAKEKRDKKDTKVITTNDLKDV